MKPIRLDAYLAQEGIASRREAKDLIERGKIFVNNKKTIEPGIKINPEQDTVTLHTKAQKTIQGKETVLVYKPRGVLSSKDTDGVKTIFSVFPQYKHLNTVGRLDKETDGIILLSNDGLVTKAITGKHGIEKEYIVKVREDVFPWMIKKMVEGLKLQDGWSHAKNAKKIDKHTFSITLTEGRNHQVRRIANKLKLTVTSLTRVRIGHLTKKGMRAGSVRIVKKTDIEKLKSVLS